MSTNNNESLDITRVLNLSTAHITKNTADTLDRCALNNDYIPLCSVYEKGEYGWYVYIDDSGEPDQIPDELSDIRDCIIFALKHDITCICFDRDTDTVVGLPVYNWEDLEQKQDAYAIKQMIYELADALEGKEKPGTPEYYNTSKLSQKVFNALSYLYDDEEGREHAETDLYNELSQLDGNSVIRAALYRLCERIEELEE